MNCSTDRSGVSRIQESDSRSQILQSAGEIIPQAAGLQKKMNLEKKYQQDSSQNRV